MAIIINLQMYGDFDMPYTDTLLMAPDSMNRHGAKICVDDVKKKFNMSRDAHAAVTELKQYGFTVCESIDITIGGGL